jgi:hypothetical protein
MFPLSLELSAGARRQAKAPWGHGLLDFQLGDASPPAAVTRHAIKVIKGRSGGLPLELAIDGTQRR